MAALIIGEAQRIAISGLRREAANMPLDPRAVEAMFQTKPALFDKLMSRLTITLPIGYRVTYSNEEQAAGMCHHLSVSVDRPGLLPSIEAVQMILDGFAMLPVEFADRMWIEQIDDARRAINVVQLIRGLSM